MTFIRIFLFISLLAVSLFGCQSQTDPAPDTCKLAAIDRGNNNKHAYTFDAQGRVTQMVREFDGSGSGKISRYVYSFTFDGAGLLTKSTWTLNGKADGTETYTYTTGRISKVSVVSADGSKLTNSLKYNAAGQITDFDYDDGDPANYLRQYFAYNTEGILIKRGFDDGKGTVYFEVVTKPTGKTTSPEQLLVKAGLPYDVLTGFSWSVLTGGQGTTTEVFVPDDQTGKLVSDGTSQTTSVKTNARGYLTEQTDLDNATRTSSTQTFTLTDCQ
jgi:hypothetical protein